MQASCRLPIASNATSPNHSHSIAFHGRSAQTERRSNNLFSRSATFKQPSAHQGCGLLDPPYSSNNMLRTKRGQVQVFGLGFLELESRLAETWTRPQQLPKIYRHRPRCHAWQPGEHASADRRRPVPCKSSGLQSSCHRPRMPGHTRARHRSSLT